MRNGTWEGRNVDDPVFRALFDRDQVLASDWYHERLQAQQTVDTLLWEKHAGYLEAFLTRNAGTGLPLSDRATAARKTLAAVRAPAYLQSLTGTIGADPTLAAAMKP
jgi:hypothetical protein